MFGRENEIHFTIKKIHSLVRISTINFFQRFIFCSLSNPLGMIHKTESIFFVHIVCWFVNGCVYRCEMHWEQLNAIIKALGEQQTSNFHYELCVCEWWLLIVALFILTIRHVFKERMSLSNLKLEQAQQEVKKAHMEYNKNWQK